MNQVKVMSEADLRSFIRTLVPEFQSRQVVLLEGPMGVGKTKFTQVLCQELGASEVMSPSFALHNQYQAQKMTIDHLDLYRLENEEELESSGFWDLFSQPKGLILIEWANRLGSHPQLDPRWAVMRVRLSFVSNSEPTARLIEWGLV